jgi:hypothetical protein
MKCPLVSSIINTQELLRLQLLAPLFMLMQV